MNTDRSVDICTLSKHRLTRQNTLRQVNASPQPVRISYLSRANHFILNLASDMFV
jgi:hypothetical protein